MRPYNSNVMKSLHVHLGNQYPIIQVSSKTEMVKKEVMEGIIP